MENEIKAKEGMVWKSKKDGAVLSDTLLLGKQDRIENYEQILKPEEVEDESRR